VSLGWLTVRAEETFDGDGRPFIGWEVPSDAAVIADTDACLCADVVEGHWHQPFTSPAIT